MSNRQIADDFSFPPSTIEPHNFGRILSSTLWNLKDVIGYEKVAEGIISAMQLIPDLGGQSSLTLFMKMLQVALPEYEQEIEEEFSRHNISYTNPQGSVNFYTLSLLNPKLIDSSDIKIVGMCEGYGEDSIALTNLEVRETGFEDWEPLGCRNDEIISFPDFYYYCLIYASVDGAAIIKGTNYDFKLTCEDGVRSDEYIIPNTVPFP